MITNIIFSFSSDFVCFVKTFHISIIQKIAGGGGHKQSIYLFLSKGAKCGYIQYSTVDKETTNSDIMMTHVHRMDKNYTSRSPSTKTSSASSHTRPPTSKGRPSSAETSKTSETFNPLNNLKDISEY